MHERRLVMVVVVVVVVVGQLNLQGTRGWKWADSRDRIGDYPQMASRTSPD
jgi:hypothetical protein